MNNLLTRSLSGAVFVVMVIGAILWHPMAFTLLFLVFSLLGLSEFFRLFNNASYCPNQAIGLLAGFCLYLSIALSSPGLRQFIFGMSVTPSKILLPNLAWIVLVFIVELYRKKEKPFENVAIVLTGLLYISLPLALLSHFFFFAEGKYTSALLLGFFLLIWTNDTFAYLCGMILGRHFLFPRISPKKTWEGSIGGAVFALLAAFVLSLVFTEFYLWQWLAIALLCIIFSTFGDLTESLMKRSLHVKDSGNLMPGHGGVLDRLDATLMAAPVIFLFILLM